MAASWAPEGLAIPMENELKKGMGSIELDGGPLPLTEAMYAAFCVCMMSFTSLYTHPTKLNPRTEAI